MQEYHESQKNSLKKNRNQYNNGEKGPANKKNKKTQKGFLIKKKDKSSTGR
ncbi:hypothetical protein IC582_013870 [Cucumis melo]